MARAKKSPKQMKTFRLNRDLARRLELTAAAEAMTETDLVENALTAHFALARAPQKPMAKQMKSFRLTSQTVRRLAQVADWEGTNETFLLETALKAHFEGLGVQ